LGDSFKEIESLAEDLKDIDRLLTRSSKETYLLRKNLSGIDKVIHTKNWEIISRFLSGTGAWRVLNKFKATMLTFMQLASIQERGALAEAQRMKELAQVAKDEKELWKVKAALEKVRQKGDKQSIEQLEKMSDMFIGLKALYGDQDKALDEMEKKINKQVDIMGKLLSGIRGGPTLLGGRFGRGSAKSKTVEMEKHKSILNSAALQSALIAGGFALNAVNLRNILKNDKAVASGVAEKQAKYHKEFAKYKEEFGQKEVVGYVTEEVAIDLTPAEMKKNAKDLQEAITQTIIEDDKKALAAQEVQTTKLVNIQREVVDIQDKTITELEKGFAEFLTEKEGDLPSYMEESGTLKSFVDLEEIWKSEVESAAQELGKSSFSLSKVFDFTKTSATKLNDALNPVAGVFTGITDDAVSDALVTSKSKKEEYLEHQKLLSNLGSIIEEYKQMGFDITKNFETFEGVPQTLEDRLPLSKLPPSLMGKLIMPPSEHDEAFREKLDEPDNPMGSKYAELIIRQQNLEKTKEFRNKIESMLQVREQKLQIRRERSEGRWDSVRESWGMMTTEDIDAGKSTRMEELINAFDLFQNKFLPEFMGGQGYLFGIKLLMEENAIEETRRSKISGAAADIMEGIGTKALSFVGKVFSIIKKMFIGSIIVLSLLFLLYRAFKSEGIAEKLGEVKDKLISFFYNWIYPGLLKIWDGIELIVKGFQSGEFWMLFAGLFKIFVGLLEVSLGIVAILLKGIWEVVKLGFYELIWNVNSMGEQLSNLAYIAGILIVLSYAIFGWPALLVGAILIGIGAVLDYFGDKMNWFAEGGTSSGGMAMVGEGGAELVNLPRGAKVYSNAESKKMLTSGKGITNNITVQVQGRIGASDMEIRENRCGGD